MFHDFKKLIIYIFRKFNDNNIIFNFQEMVRKDGGSDFADMTSLYKPKGIRQMSMPPTHMTKQSVATLKDTSEKRDHIVQRVNAVYHQE